MKKVQFSVHRIEYMYKSNNWVTTCYFRMHSVGL